MSMDKKFYVYILASSQNGTLYVGVTSNLARRLDEHRTKTTAGFTAKYSVDKLVYYEVFSDAENAIAREKRLKSWRRTWKLELIEQTNPEWNDLWSTLNH